MRNPYFDNAKAILIFLVVFGHLIALRGQAADGVYWLIYSFHMPAFIFIAGYFTKKETWKQTIHSCLTYFFIPYLLFQSLYNGYNYLVFGRTINPDFVYANFSLWFLLAMMYWKVTLQCILRSKWFFLPLLGLYLSHRFYIEDLKFLAIGRAMTFSVFFYIGHFAKQLTPKVMSELKKVPHRHILLPLVGCIGMFVVYYLYTIEYIDIERKWFYGAFTNFNTLMKTESIVSLLWNQVSTTLFSCLMIVFFLCVVPKKRYVWTSIGTATLSVYLLHGFFRNYLMYNDYAMKITNMAELGAFASLALVIVYLCSRKPCCAFVEWTTQLFHKKEQ